MSPILLCLIHGLNASAHSFAYMAKELPFESFSVNYNSQRTIEESTKHVLRQLPKNKELVLVGHSLGGLIALLIAIDGKRNVKQVITISSPLGGSKAASYMRWITLNMNVFDDLTPCSDIIKKIQENKPTCPILSIVSTGGHLPITTEPNDGVVTISSQRALENVRHVEVKANHAEVLLHDKTVRTIADVVDQLIKKSTHGKES